jgi:hypothetical protein
VLGAVVALRVALNHPVGCPAVYETVAARPLSVPPPAFVTATVWSAGFTLPASPVKFLLVFDSAISGPACGWTTVKVTLTL